MELTDSRGRVFQISDADAPEVLLHRWIADAKGSRRKLYIVRSRDHLPLHRFLMGLKRGDAGVVDHINGDTLDNRRENLRVVDTSTNGLNRHVYSNSAGLPGAHRFRPGSWTSRLTIRGVRRHLGVFDSPEAASQAYLAARSEAGLP